MERIASSPRLPFGLLFQPRLRFLKLRFFKSQHKAWDASPRRDEESQLKPTGLWKGGRQFLSGRVNSVRAAAAARLVLALKR